MPETSVPEETAAQKAERIGSSCYVEGMYLYVLDGGSRGYSGADDWSYGGSTSYRLATEEEIELWGLIP